MRSQRGAHIYVNYPASDEDLRPQVTPPCDTATDGKRDSQVGNTGTGIAAAGSETDQGDSVTRGSTSVTDAAPALAGTVGSRWADGWKLRCPVCSRDHTQPEPDYQYGLRAWR